MTDEQQDIANAAEDAEQDAYLAALDSVKLNRKKYRMATAAYHSDRNTDTYKVLDNVRRQFLAALDKRDQFEQL